MHVNMEICLVPIGVGTSVSEYIAACQRVLEDAGLEFEMHAYGTNVEGDWDRVFAALRRCHETVHEMGAARIFTALKVGTRTDRTQSLADKVTSVREKLEIDPGQGS